MWETSNLKFYMTSMTYAYIGSAVFISFKILFISVIGILAKGHIGATLHTLAGMHMHN